MHSKVMERYFFFGLLVTTLLFTFFIFRPFWIILILGISFSIVLFPIYEWLDKRKLPHWFSAFLTVLVFVVIVAVLIFGVGAIVLHQSENVYNLVVSSGHNVSFIDSLNTSINKALPAGVTFDLHEKVSAFIMLFTSKIAGLFTSIVSQAFYFLLTCLAIFYFLKDNAVWKKELIIFSPLSDADDQKIIAKFANTVNGILKGYLLVAFIQATLVSIGFFIFGVPNPVLWGLVAVITALIPTIGTGLVSIPAIIFLLATGHQTNAIGLAVWALLLVGTIDNILNPLILGSKVNLPPLLILFSVLGGISLFGPVGILVGPLSVSLLYTLISIYRNEFQQLPANKTI